MRELYRQRTSDLLTHFQGRFAAIRQADQGDSAGVQGQGSDGDPRDGFVSASRPDGEFQAIFSQSQEGFEYTARVVDQGQVVRLEQASFDGTDLVATHYESGAQVTRYCGPAYFQDITQETEGAWFLSPTLSEGDLVAKHYTNHDDARIFPNDKRDVSVLTEGVVRGPSSGLEPSEPVDADVAGNFARCNAQFEARWNL